MSIDRKALLAHIRRNFALDWRGIHGAPHWGRVLDNGLRLAELTGARVEVVELFAFLHDARRLDDGTDPAHGHRAADLALQRQGRTFEIENSSLDLLVAACRGHSDGMTEADATCRPAGTRTASTSDGSERCPIPAGCARPPRANAALSSGPTGAASAAPRGSCPGPEATDTTKP
jgi:uncharacterized protein